MIFVFPPFKFDSRQRVLTKNGVIISLNDKQSRLLDLFLTESENIHSKAGILEHVWSDRVVTEQVVFQNISYLRSLFGDKAIRTFSKKGYQWQIPLTVETDKEETPTQSISKEINQEANGDLEEPSPALKESEEKPQDEDGLSVPEETQVKSVIGKKKGLEIVVLALLVLALLIYLHSGENVQPKVTMETTQSFVLDEYSQRNNYTVSIPPQRVFDSPYHTFNEQKLAQDKVLLATRSYPVAEGVVLRFYIQGFRRGWYDHVMADSLEGAEAKLNLLLQRLVGSSYFTAENSYQALAELTLLAGRYPDSLLLPMQQIKLNFKLQDYTRASVTAELMRSQGLSDIRTGLLHLEMAEVNMWDQNWSATEHEVTQALQLFAQLNLPHLESMALVRRAWLHLVNEEFRQGMTTLNLAANKARAAKEPLLEVDAHRTQSMMASKAGQLELAHTQIDLANELITLHQLGEQHRAANLSSFTYIVETREEKLKYSRDILDMPYTPLYDRFFYGAAADVRDNAIEQQQWSEAQSFYRNWQRGSFVALSKAQIAFAQNQYESAVALGLQAFSLAQIEHQLKDGLDAALLLLMNDFSGGDSISRDMLVDFIQQNATKRWRQQNRKLLEQASPLQLQ